MRTKSTRTDLSAGIVMQSQGGARLHKSVLSLFNGTVCGTLASSAARAVSQPVRKNCAGRLMSSLKSAIADCPTRCSGRRSTSPAQSLRRSICEAERSSLLSLLFRKDGGARKDKSPTECEWNTFTHGDLLSTGLPPTSLSRAFQATSRRTAVQLHNLFFACS